MVKIGGNFMLAALIETLGEAFALTRSYGIDPEVFLEVMTSTIFPAPVYHAYGGMVARDTYEPAGFRLSLGLKDVKLALSAAEDRTVPMPLGSLVRDQFLTALARGYHDFDWAGLGRVCAEDAGLPPRK
jgi:3-hydroxyisobutyrate dehydrogenase-like beta-hydroxyacid dehydrogenase